LIQEEKELFLQIADGDEKAFEQLVARYSLYLLPFLQNLTSSEAVAREIMQDTFLRIWVHREKLPHIEQPRPWIFRIAANLAYSWLRKMAVEEKALTQKEISEASNRHSHDDPMVLKELRQVLHEAIGNLPGRRKHIYQLHRNEGLKVAEIAELLKVSPNTVKNSLMQARASIREHLIKAGYSLPLIALMLFLA
jgi:RNA polymerase sigma-70 factor (family 1)